MADDTDRSGQISRAADASSPTDASGDIEQQCPPADAFRGPIHLFRLIQTEAPQATDFLTAEERDVYKDKPPCIRRSLSSYQSRLDASRLRSRVPHFRNHYICCGVVPADAGWHLSTPSRHQKSHHSWWPEDGIRRESYFRLCVT